MSFDIPIRTWRPDFVYTAGDPGRLTFGLDTSAAGLAATCTIGDGAGTVLATLSTDGRQAATVTVDPSTPTGSTLTVTVQYTDTAPRSERFAYTLPRGVGETLAGLRMTWGLVEREPPTSIYGTHGALVLNTSPAGVVVDDARGLVDFGVGGAFAVSVRLRSSQPGCLVSAVGPAGAHVFALWLGADGRVGFDIDIAGTGARTYASPPTRALDDRWHCVTVARQGAFIAFYLDGRLVGDALFEGGATAAFARGAVEGLVFGKAATPTAARPDTEPALGLPRLAQFTGTLLDVRIDRTGLPSPAAVAAVARDFPTSSVPLAGYWNFAAGVDDLTGRSGPGSVFGGVVAPTRIEPAGGPMVLVTRGLLSRAEARYMPALALGDCTLEAWVRTSTGGPVLSQTTVDPVAGPIGFVLAVTPGGALRITAASETVGSSGVLRPATLTDGRWHHVAAVRSGTSWTLYVDAKPGMVAGGEVVPILALDAPILLGASAAVVDILPPGPPVVGEPAPVGLAPAIDLSAVRIWSTARGQPQIYMGQFQQLEPARHPDLVAQWTFEDGALNDSAILGYTRGEARAVDFVGGAPSLQPALRALRGGGELGGARAAAIASYPFGGGAYSVETWMRLPDGAASGALLFAGPMTGAPPSASAGGVPSAGVWALWGADASGGRTNAVTVIHRTGIGADRVWQTPTVDLADGAWHHVALVFASDPARYTVFVDGAEGQTHTTTSPVPAWLAPTHLELAFSDTSTASAPIDLAEFRIWNRRLGVEEIRRSLGRAPAPDTLGLVAAWDFRYGDGYDRSPSANHLRFDPGVRTLPFEATVGLPPSEMSFTAGGHGEVSNAADLAFTGRDPYSFAAWIALDPDASTDGAGIIIGRYDDGVAGQYRFGVRDRRLFGGRNVAPWSVEGTTALVPGRWYHAAATYDGQSLSLYLDGVLEASADFGANPGQLAEGPEIGGGRRHGVVDPALSFPGAMTTLAVWDRGLTSTQVWDLAYRLEKADFPAPIAAWDFHRPTLVDQTGRGHRFVPAGSLRLTATDWSPLAGGRALTFAGVGSRVDCGPVKGLDGPGSMSIEAWIRVVSAGTDPIWLVSVGEGVGLYSPAGSDDLRFVVTGVGEVGLGGADLADGAWHHYAGVFDAAAGRLSLVVDGRRVGPPLSAAGAPTFPAERIGFGGPVAGAGADLQMHEVRVWRRALSVDDDIGPRMSTRLSGAEPDLAGYWSAGTVSATELDRTGGGRDGTYAGDVRSGRSPFQLAPPLPVVEARSRMMQTWQTAPGAAAPEETTRYQTVITVTGASGQPSIGATLRVWAEDEVVLLVDGEPKLAGPSTAVELVTDSSGAARVSVEAGGLGTPSLKIWAPTMKSDARVVISPDAHVIDGMAGMSGADLQSPRHSQPALIPAGEAHADAADNVATALSHMSQTVKAPGTVEPGVARKRFAGSRRSMKQAAHEVGDIASVAVSEADAIWARPIGPGAVPSWGFDITDQSIGPVGSAARGVGQRLRFRALEHADVAALARRAKRMPGRPDARKTGSMWHAFVHGVKKATRFVVTTAEHIEHEVEDAIGVIVEMGEEVYSWAVDTVRHVGEAAMGLLTQVLAEIYDDLLDYGARILAWFRDEFGWSDVLNTKRAIAHVVDQAFVGGKELIDVVMSKLDAVFAAAEGKVEDIFDAAIDAIGDLSIRTASTDPLGGGHARRRQAAAAGAGADPSLFGGDSLVAQNWLWSMASDGVSDDDPVRGPDFTALGQGVADRVGDIVSTLLDGIADDDAVRILGQAVEQFASIRDNPDSWPQMALAGLLRVVEGVAVLMLELVDDALDFVLELLELLLGELRSMVSMPLEIPLVSWFYENVVTWDPETGRGDALTALDFVALLIAIPTTFTYKLAFGRAPFQAADVDTVLGYSLDVPDYDHQVVARAVAGLDSTAFRRLRQVHGRRVSASASSASGKDEEPVNPWPNTKASGHEMAWSIAYGFAYLLWWPVDTLLDAQQVEYTAGLPGQTETKTSGIDYTANRGMKGLKIVLHGMAYLLPTALQAFSWLPSGPGSKYTDKIMASQGIDWAFWSWKSFMIVVNGVIEVGMQGVVLAGKRIQPEKFDGVVYTGTQAELDDLSPWVRRGESVLKAGGLLRRFVPLWSTATGVIWLCLSTAVAIAETVEAHDADAYADNVEAIFLKTLQNTVEGISPLAKFLGMGWMLDATSGASFVALLVADGVSDAGATALTGLRVLLSAVED